MARLAAALSKAAATLLALWVSGCANTAYLAVDEQAAGFGLQRVEVAGEPFAHVVYRSAAERPGEVLHVYIEGDGIPWRHRTVIASDPTARNNLMLRLMNRDPTPSIYVGRPCYFGLLHDPACEPDIWTFSRYSPQVVDSMAAAIRAQAARYQKLVLLGHSGGGALAVLLAEQLPRVAAVVTVAGNLNVAGWTTHHGYTPLYGSLDPADRPPLPASVRQLHLLGARDRKVPPTLAEGWIAAQAGADVWRFDHYTHGCCWGDVWPRVLEWLRAPQPASSGAEPVEQLSGVVADHAVDAQLQ